MTTSTEGEKKGKIISMEEYFSTFQDQYCVKLLMPPKIITISTFNPNLEEKLKKKGEQEKRAKKVSV